MISKEFQELIEKCTNMINQNKWIDFQYKVEEKGYNFSDIIEFGKICDKQRIKGFFTTNLYYYSVLNKISRSIQDNVNGKVSGAFSTEYIEFELINNDDGEVFIGGRLYFSNSNIEFDMWNNGEVILGWNELLDYLDNIFKDNEIKIVVDPKAYKVEILK